LEPLERVYVSLQGTGTDPSIQGDGEIGRVSGGSVLTVVLGKAVPAGRLLLNGHVSCTRLFRG